MIDSGLNDVGKTLLSRWKLRLSAEHTIERVARLIDESFGPMWERMEVLESEVASIAHSIERLQNGRPIDRAIQQRAEGFEFEFGASQLAVLLQMDVLDSLSADVDPVLGELKLHDVAGVEMHFDMVALEAIDEGIHLLRTKQEAVGKDVFEVEIHAQLFSNG